MEENSKNDTLSREALFPQLPQKTPIECHLLCNRKLKIKSGYTLHLKKCSKNVHVSQIRLKQLPRGQLLHLYQHLYQP